MGKRRGLDGDRTSLFFEVIRIISELRPRWLVLENVTGLLNCHDGRDFQTVIGSLSECGYLGVWRVLNAAHFGVPTRRRRVFMVAGFHEYPPLELLADAAAVEPVLSAAREGSTLQWSYPTLLAGSARPQINISGSGLVFEADGRDQMVKRQRASDDHGFCLGLDDSNFVTAQAAGNAVVPQVAEWVARKLIRTF